MKIMKPANRCCAGSIWIIRNFAEAGRDDEYLLGKNILVAPVLQGSMQIVPADWLKTPAASRVCRRNIFTNENLSGPPAFTRTDAAIDFDWDQASPRRTFRARIFPRAGAARLKCRRRSAT